MVLIKKEFYSLFETVCMAMFFSFYSPSYDPQFSHANLWGMVYLQYNVGTLHQLLDSQDQASCTVGFYEQFTQY